MLVNYMEQARENGEFSARLNGCSRDPLVDKVSNRSIFHNNGLAEEEDDGIELSLGLSLNGRFGVDPKNDRIELIRSSSVSAFSLVGGDNHAPSPTVSVSTAAAYAPLSRAYSLPTDVEAENWRKRKELQSLRRMEAKRRRMGKIKSLRSGREKVDSEDNSSEEYGSNSNSNGPGLVSSTNANGAPWSQRSVGSQGSSSSGLSEFESQPIQAVDRIIEARSSPSAQSVQVQNEQKPQVIPRSRVAEAADKGATEAKEMLKNLMLEMPCVSTIGNGPNGRKVDGFLYRYGRGEEVKIVCVCHGSFLSPAEFVKHAGGAEVENPLRHIVVNPSLVL